MIRHIFGKYGWLHVNILRRLMRPYWILRAKFLRYKYIKKYGFTPEEAILHFGKYVRISEK